MSSVIVDSRMSESCKRRLSSLGFFLIELPKFAALPDAISAHPDTLISRIGNELFATADYCDTAPYVFSDIRERHAGIKISFTSDRLSDKYPEDCKLNALVLGNNVFVKRESASSAMIDAALRLGYNIVSTRQGYPACTTLAARGKHHDFAVTSDGGMAKLLQQHGVTVSMIRAGGISLPPYEYGFIGGSAGVYRDKIYFAGDLCSHPDSKIIENAARDAGFECVSLSSEPLCDVGGMIFID